MSILLLNRYIRLIQNFQLKAFSSVDRSQLQVHRRCFSRAELALDLGHRPYLTLLIPNFFPCLQLVKHV